MFRKICLFKYLTQRFEILKFLPRKATARNPYSMIVKEDGEKKFVAAAESRIQKFYLKRSIFMQKQFIKEYAEFFEIILPDEVINIDSFLCVVYPFVEDLSECKDVEIADCMNKLYKRNSVCTKPSQETIQKILDDMLGAWPPEFYNRFMREECLERYLDLLKKQSILKIYKEHGDFNCENVLKKNGKYYLFDFEFARLYQPVGQDIAEYEISIGRSYIEDDSVADIKIQMCDTFNHIVDGRKWYKYQTYLENHILFPFLEKAIRIKRGLK